MYIQVLWLIHVTMLNDVVDYVVGSTFESSIMSCRPSNPFVESSATLEISHVSIHSIQNSTVAVAVAVPVSVY